MGIVALADSAVSVHVAGLMLWGLFREGFDTFRFRVLLYLACSGAASARSRHNGFDDALSVFPMTDTGSAPLFRVDEVGSWGALYWLGLLCSVGIAGINLYVWTLTGMPHFLAVAGSFVFGVGLFFTRFWSPAVYLVGVVHVIALGVVWVLGGRAFLVLGAVNGIFSVGLLAVALWLFFAEYRTADD
ncbi:hypothetical protein Hlac_1697 [Halorubrum lacusprofundi ATCC 49239]|uniref:Uncharacterized protein n=2 Tax=Halorubrum lacusprofundi TaxID=2247 RepID=B9LPJ4_HALLT|nr:hypothetical protein Hlac_1697 [Halorubrum lacusprofundi ATCC 49239]